MPLSERTIAEMRAGAATVAAHAGAHGIDEAYMEAMIRTQQRAKWLKVLQSEGRVRVEQQSRPHTSSKVNEQGIRISTRTVVWVGDNEFTDESAELTGAFPSEVLVAQVAMALAAGEGEKPKTKVTTYYDATRDMHIERSWDGSQWVERVVDGTRDGV